MTNTGFVYVIESPSSSDLLDGRTEGNALIQALDLAGIPRWYSLVTNRATLVEALESRLRVAWQQYGVPPVLHLSMHGNQDGVALTDGKQLSWNDLRGLLLPLIRAMQGGLLICMSTCFGGSGCRMAMHVDNEYPFWALIGNNASPTWPDAAVAYITFFHLFFKGYGIPECVNAMKTASGDQNFAYFSGSLVRASWNAHIQQQLSQIAPQLDQATKTNGA